MPAPTKPYRLTRFINDDGSYDIHEDICFVGRDPIPSAGFLYPGDRSTDLCDDHPNQELRPGPDGRPTCSTRGRQPEA